MPTAISINRAPVLTLWVAVVAQRLGFRRDESLSLGKALAGLNAQSKGRRLGIVKPHEGDRLGIDPSSIAVVSGHGSPAKVVAVEGMDDDAIRQAFPREKSGKPVV